MPRTVVCEDSDHQDFVVVRTDNYSLDRGECPICEANKKLKILAEIDSAANRAPELNMGNYDEEEVRELNNSMIEICKLLRSIS